MSWGNGLWGQAPWGSGSTTGELRLLSAEPTAENVVRLRFDQAVRMTGIADPHDGMNAARYAITPVAGTYGSDGFAARPVRVLAAKYAEVTQGGGTLIDLTLDRAMSREPSQYLVAVNQLIGLTTGDALAVDASSATFTGLGVAPDVNAREVAISRTDIANPQTTLGLGTQAGQALGSYAADETGDYATDAGIASYKKRIARRVSYVRGRTAHAPGYGVGLPAQSKKLQRGGVLEALKADAERQIRLEPETQEVAVTATPDPTKPELVWLKIKARTKAGETVETSVRLTVGV